LLFSDFKNAVEELVAAEPVAPVIPESLRDKAAKEIFTSEASYVKSLQQLSDVRKDTVHCHLRTLKIIIK
jgi:hypothetical protein